MRRNGLLALGVAAFLLVGRVPVRADDVPDEARKLLEDYDKDAEVIKKKADEEIRARKDKLVKALKQIQDRLCRDAKLDEAVAIRDKIRELKGVAIKAMPDPGTLSGYANDVGKPLYFEVTGRTNATIWGSDIYTADSALATVAVHAGILKDGEKGVVKVTMIKYEGLYDGNTRNGVTSNPYGVYMGSYRVEAVPKD